MKAGDNPHQWYSPSSVHRVVAQIVADYDRLDPPASGYFAQREREFEGRDLARYDALRREIRARYAGVRSATARASSNRWAKISA